MKHLIPNPTMSSTTPKKDQPIMRGKSVSRAVYQRKAEEAKKLRADLRSIVLRKQGWEEVVARYRDLFQQEDSLANALRQYARDYFEHQRNKN